MSERLSHILSGQHSALIQAQLEQLEKAKRRRVTQRTLERLKTDPAFRLLFSLRSRVRAALKAQRTPKKARGLLGCSTPELRAHIESLFTEGMTWGNYGKWHLDHIRPVSSFDLFKLSEQKECFHYTNLQPLWAKDNHAKGSKWNPWDDPAFR